MLTDWEVFHEYYQQEVIRLGIQQQFVRNYFFHSKFDTQFSTHTWSNVIVWRLADIKLERTTWKWTQLNPEKALLNTTAWLLNQYLTTVMSSCTVNSMRVHRIEVLYCLYGTLVKSPSRYFHFATVHCWVTFTATTNTVQCGHHDPPWNKLKVTKHSVSIWRLQSWYQSTTFDQAAFNYSAHFILWGVFEISTGWKI